MVVYKTIVVHDANLQQDDDGHSLRQIATGLRKPRRRTDGEMRGVGLPPITPRRKRQTLRHEESHDLLGGGAADTLQKHHPQTRKDTAIDVHGRRERKAQSVQAFPGQLF